MRRVHPPTTEPKSAARLAAEAAFAPAMPTRQPLSDSNPPEITVLRAKRVALRTDAADAAPAPPAPKTPRVFLLNPAGVDGSTTAPDLSSHSHAQTAAAGLVGSGRTATSTPVPRAKRRLNKPQPVTLIFAASSPLTALADIDAAHAPSIRAWALQPPTQEDASVQLSVDLSAALSELTPIFSVIRSATVFTVVDLQFAAQWQRLSKALDQTAADIKAASGKSPLRKATRLIVQTSSIRRTARTKTPA